MKFARVLRTTAEDLPNLPELQALFSAYKQLKKQIKKMPYKDAVQHRDSGPGMAELAGSQAGPPACVAEAAGGAASPALAQPSAAVESCEQGEVEFIESLGRALAQMNDLFLEKEEECVIRVEQLEGALAAAGGDVVQLGSIHKQLVDFHGEVLLLVHFAILAYTATVKILKKHHKRTGLLLRAPLGNLLSQPFCSTEMMTDIAHRLEADINELCKRMQSAGGGAPASQEAIDGPPAADAAPAGGSGGLVPQLSGNRVDLAFLQQLVEAEGSDTPTSSPSGEDNGEGGSQLSGDQGGQGGERLAHAAAAAEEAVNGPEVLGGAVEADGAVPERNQQQQHHQQERLQWQAWGREEALNDLLRRQSATSSGRSSDAVCDVGAQPPCKRARQCLPSPALQQQVQAVASPVKQQQMLAAPHPVAAEGPAAPGASSSLQLHAAGHAMGRGKGTGSLLKAQNPIASQAQVALTTWENLIASAATPSTVMAQLPATTACTQTTESSVA